MMEAHPTHEIVLQTVLVCGHDGLGPDLQRIGRPWAESADCEYYSFRWTSLFGVRVRNRRFDRTAGKQHRHWRLVSDGLSDRRYQPGDVCRPSNGGAAFLSDSRRDFGRVFGQHSRLHQLESWQLVEPDSEP